MEISLQGSVPEVQHTGNGQGQKDSEEENFSCGVPNLPYRLPHLWLPRLHPRRPTSGRSGGATQMLTKVNKQIIYWTLTISHRFSGPSIRHHNWECPPPLSCGIWWHIIHCGAHGEGNSPRKLEKPGRGALRAFFAGKLHYCKTVASLKILNKAPTKGGLDRILSGIRYPRPVSRVLSPGLTHWNDRRDWISTGNRVQLRYYKPLHQRGSPSTRAEPPGEQLQ